jgi:hypothetical protein
MSKRNELEFANFILKFGMNLNLIDFAEEIVLPAFKDTTMIRSWGETRHFFHDVEILNFGNESNPILCIVGEYIKDTKVTREQVYDPNTGQLRKDSKSLHTSPSAIFTLVLNNHKLIYFSKTASAPGILAFKTTVENFIKDKYHGFIDDMYRENRHQGVTKKELYQRYNPPLLEIVPLAREGLISEFINQYGLLNKVEIKLLTTNNDIDNNGLFIQNVREAKEEALSSVTTITHSSNINDGLSKGVIARQVQSALSQGNAKVQLKGKDRQGHDLEGNTETFKINMQLTTVPQGISEIGAKCYESFQALVAQGIIPIGNPIDNVLERIKKIWDNVNRNS